LACWPKDVTLAVFVQFEGSLQDEIRPSVMDQRGVGVLGIDRFSPLVIGLTDLLANRWIGLLQPLWECLLEYRFSQEWSGYVHHRQPLTMPA